MLEIPMPEASRRPSGEKARRSMRELVASRSHGHAGPVAASRRRIVPSRSPVATVRPSAERASEQTCSSRSDRTATSRRDSRQR